MELLGHELYKVFGRRMIWIGMFLAVALICLSSLSQAAQLKNMYGDIRTYYSDFFQGKEGPVSASLQKEAKEWMMQNANSYAQKFSQGGTAIQDNRTFYFYGQTLQPQDLLTKRSDEIAKLQDESKTAGSDYQSRADFLQATMLKDLENPGLYFTLPLAIDTNFSYGLGFCLMGILILLGISPVFSEEYTSKMDALILSARKGRRQVVTSKIIASAVYCAFVAVAVLAANFLCLAFALGIHGWTAPLQLIFEQSPYALSVGGYLLTQAGISIVGCIFFGMLVLLVSSVSPNVLVPFFLCGSLFSATAFIESTFSSVAPAAIKAFGDLSYTELIRVEGLFESFKTYNLFGRPVMYPDLILVLYAAITALVIFLTYRLFSHRQVS